MYFIWQAEGEIAKHYKKQIEFPSQFSNYFISNTCSCPIIIFRFILDL